MTADTVGGVWSYSLELCRALQPFGIEVVLATMGAPLRQAQRIEAAGVENIQVIESRYKLEWMANPWRDLDAAGTWLEMIEAQFAPDLIHLNGFAHATLPWSVPVVVVAHSDVLTWWQAVHRKDAPVEWSRYAELVRRGLQAADLVVAPSRALLDALIRSYGEIRNSRVIYNARDPARYAPREKEAFVLCAGRLWDEAKNARALAEIAADVGWPIRVAGEQTTPDGTHVTLRNVELLGPWTPGEMADFFARASIYAHPARYEPFGLTVLEAALSGCALVLGDIPSLREIWGDAAVYVPPDDRAALQAALAHLISDAERRAELAAGAHRRARQFTVDRMVDAYLAAYADAARSASATDGAPVPLRA